jgi:hypothetical protein
LAVDAVDAVDAVGVVVPHGGLAGPAEPAAVVSDHTISGGRQNPLLPLPGMAVEPVPVNEHDRRPWPWSS